MTDVEAIKELRACLLKVRFHVGDDGTLYCPQCGRGTDHHDYPVAGEEPNDCRIAEVIRATADASEVRAEPT